MSSSGVQGNQNLRDKSNRPQLAMQRPQPDPQRLPPRAPSLGFGEGGAFGPTQRIGEPSSQDAAAAAAAAEAGRERAVRQMAYEDAWKACNPDIKTPFASVEDAVSRLLPYHVFADYDEDDVCDAYGSGAKSRAELWHNGMEDRTLDMVSEFEKQVLAFNLLARGRADGSSRGEELYMLERNLLREERVQSEHARAVIVQQEKQRQEEAARTRLAFAHAEAQAKAQAQLQAQAQAQAASVWQMAQAQAQAQSQAQAQAASVWQMAQAQAQGHANSWQQAIVAAMACGEGFPGVTGQMAAPSMSMLPQHDPAAVRALLMMQQQQQQQLQQLGMGVWPTFVSPGGESSSSGQAVAPAVLQDQAGGQTTTSGAAAARTIPQWWQNAAPKEQ